MPQTVITKTVKLHRVQQAFRQSSALVRGFVGGRGAGKSWIGAYDMLRRAKPNRLYMALAPTYTVLGDATWRSLIEIGMHLQFIAKQNKSHLSLTLGNGAQILGRSADNPERLRGPNLSGLWIDEGSQTPEDAYLIGLACLREAGEMGWLTSTFTPRGKQHWTYKVFGGDGAAMFHCPTEQNPFLPPQFAPAIRSRYPSALAEQELGGLFLDIMGAVFKAAWFEGRTWNEIGGAYRLTSPGAQDRIIAADKCQIITIVDPASSEKHLHREEGELQTDFTAIGTFALTPDNDLLVLDMVRERLGIDGIVPRLFEVCQRWHPAYVACEANGFQIAIVKEARRRTGMPPIKEITPHNKAKLVRATEAIVRAESGQVFLPKHQPPWVGEFIAEVLVFTGRPPEKGEDHVHDDQVDCLAYAALLQSRKITADAPPFRPTVFHA